MTADARSHRDAESANRDFWDEVAPVHLEAYKEVAMLREGREVLDEIELQEVGDVAGKSMLHLQCHIGTDTLAWERHGAAVTGLDFSGESIACAERLRDELGLGARFVQSNIYDARSVLEEAYDIVYTSKGVLTWLRDIVEWGRVVAHFLKPGGLFYLMEMHPFLNVLEMETAGDLTFKYRYFHQPEAIVWEDDADYANPDYIAKTASHEWDWTVSDIVNALLDAGLELDFVHEYEKLFFKLFSTMTTDDGRWFTLPDYAGKLPLLLTMRARKPA